jgi:integrase
MPYNRITRRATMANGEGYIRSRSKGSHTITIYLGKDERGRPSQLTRTVRGTRKQAEAELARLVTERDQGVDLKPKQATFAELAQRWRDSHYPDLSCSAVETYESHLRIHILPVLGKLRIQDIRPLDVEAVKHNVVKAGRSQKLALNVFRTTSLILKQAVRWQLLSRNPADAVEPPKARKFVPNTPSPKQLEVILEVADQTPYGPVARLAVLTGARQSELLHLAWSDVQWEQQALIIKGTKTERSFRSIELGDLALALLREHRGRELEKRLKLGPGATCGGDSATIFTNLVGNPMDAGGLKRTWRRILRDANAGHVRFHDLRHASATYMLAAGAPLVAVSARLGHTRTSTTTDIYAHVLPGMGREAADLLDSLMVNTWSKAKEA